MQSSRLYAYFLLAASMTLVGSYVALCKPLTAALPVDLLAWLRFAIAACALLPWTFSSARRLSWREHKQLFFMSFFGNFLFSICMLHGIALTSAVTAGVVMAALPALVALLSWVWLKEQLRPRQALAITFAVSAIALLQLASNDIAQLIHAVASSSGLSSPWQLLGTALLLAAVLCEAIYVILARRLANTGPAVQVSAQINLWGLALATPLVLLQTGLQAAFDAVAALNRAQWGLLLFYALAASVFAVWLWMTGIRSVQAHEAGVFTVALPLSASAIGVGLFNEPLTALHLGALILTLASVLLVAARPGRPQRVLKQEPKP